MIAPHCFDIYAKPHRLRHLHLQPCPHNTEALEQQFHGTLARAPFLICVACATQAALSTKQT